MEILNLYCGKGGNRELWGNKHNITAVELNEKVAAEYQMRFPNDTVIVADAHEYLLNNFKGFDFIWSSPPCPTHSRTNYFTQALEKVVKLLSLITNTTRRDEYIKSISKIGKLKAAELAKPLERFFKDAEKEKKAIEADSLEEDKLPAIRKVSTYPDMKLWQEIIYLNQFYKGLWCIENVIPYYEPFLPQYTKIGRHFIWSNFKIPVIEMPKNEIGTMMKKYVGTGKHAHDKSLVDRNAVNSELGLHILNCAVENILIKKDYVQHSLFGNGM